MTTLENKTALVTGASRGIGRATAVALAKAGARVLVHYGRSKQEAESLVAQIQSKGGSADAISVDLGTPEGAGLLARQVPPSDVVWRTDAATADLFARPQAADTAPASAFVVPRAFVELAEQAALHRDEDRFTLLYRLLWRLRGEHRLIALASDPDVARLGSLARAVRRGSAIATSTAAPTAINPATVNPVVIAEVKLW